MRWDVDSVVWVDVLIPAFNAEKTIEASLLSIARQSHRHLRMIVVDDGSTDRTSDILRDFKVRDDRLTFVSTENKGIVAALNLALSLSDAPFVARHDADDLSYPDRIARQLDYLLRHEDCVAVGANARHVDSSGNWPGYTTGFRGEVRGDAEAIPAVEPYLMHPFLLARRAAIDAVGGYRYSLHSEDTDLYWRLLDQGRLHNMADVLGDYMVHDGSVTGGSVQNGRVSSLYSQLTALSYRRRLRGEPDIAFPPEALTATKRLHSLRALIEHVSPGLQPHEIDYLNLAVPAKLLENASYRPYLLEEVDCRHIAAAFLRILRALPRQGRRKLQDERLAVMVRLRNAGRRKEAAALRPSSWREYPSFLPAVARRATLKVRRLLIG